ncbi:MAG: hypothetical protein RMJ16_00525 [Thermoguttaceae bacterium]|nr:hypothetical protein [Thermoguttaceae bacterium]
MRNLATSCSICPRIFPPSFVVHVCVFLLSWPWWGIVWAQDQDQSWTIFITNDNCPDYTWGLTEEQTREAFAEIVRAHLDEMTRTDPQPFENRNRYNAAVTQEVLCFVEKYPDRKEELIARIKEGRLYVSPYLCNSLWAFQDVEGLLRTFYPACRLEREWGIPWSTSAHHIELPSLPWGHATLLAGCGIKYLTVPFLGYDSTFSSLKVPPLFYHEGPDGSRVMVCLDVFASARRGYTQGAHVLQLGDRVYSDWLAYYAGLGDRYPFRVVLASGTHGDISPRSGKQARAFAEQIIRANARSGGKVRYVNATFPMFWEAVEKSGLPRPPLGVVRGDFGHSWDLWPVSLSRYVSMMRIGQRRLLAAEALLAVASALDSEVNTRTIADRRQAEWYWAMLSDHAWNGTDSANKDHNAQLRRKWAEGLLALADRLTSVGWEALGAVPSAGDLVLFNPLSFGRKAPVFLPLDTDQTFQVIFEGKELPSQIVLAGDKRVLCFISPEVPPFGFAEVKLVTVDKPRPQKVPFVFEGDTFEGPFYRATVDRKTGGLSSVVHKPTGKELVVRKQGEDGLAALCESRYHDGQEHRFAQGAVAVDNLGPVCARLKITGKVGPIDVTNYVTFYSELDQVDFELHVHMPRTEKENRFWQIFPVCAEGSIIRLATTGAIIRPQPQPVGDLVPGADTRRFAVQEFVDCSTADSGVTIALVDPFVLRMDLTPISIQSLGNDQNYREVTRDQHGHEDFVIRYALTARQGGWNGAAAMAFARSATCPVLVFRGRLLKERNYPRVSVDPRRAVATCLKPADDPAAGGVILRIWETAGRSEPLEIGLQGFGRACLTDLLERDLGPLTINKGMVRVDLKAHGFAAVRLLPANR